MKSNSKKLIGLIKLVLDVAWYGNFALALFAFGALSYEFSTKEFVETSTEVSIPMHVISKPVASSNEIQMAVLSTREALLTYKAKVTPTFVAVSVLFFFAIEALLISIIYNLRKVFRYLDQNKPFAIKVVSCLKWASLFIALILPLNALLHIYGVALLNSDFQGARFSEKIDLNIEVLAIAAILYITAEIFNHGLELKVENEEFV